MYTVGHPICFNVRNARLEYSNNITNGNNVWIGGNSVINSGIKIHDNVIIGAGSIVTRNIPSGVIEEGNS